MVDRKTLIGCSEYSNGCTFSIGKTIASKKLTEKNIKDLLEKGITPVIKGFKSSKAKKLRQRKTR
ncbi:topoisomerase C-terminal repeat-containing protein [Domibacillus indicus]|nr:topoisomerase C-terminal repeat-containing protein [Domibacillus indicus]MCM3791202.1 topoisomerase C-terminal repeat-containing protein [Domibacillus indicus]